MQRLPRGEPVKEALENIEEGRKLWMESMYQDGNEIPIPGAVKNKYSVHLVDGRSLRVIRPAL
jgi:predicted RNase H-like HicB family nuclease